jgi:acyl transferase domain-containing protein/NADPH:quinone reductase-like Zn-dependent oxidoreductase
MVEEIIPPANRHGQKNMPIAIVGMSCRFPGDATTPSKFWQMLAEGRDAWTTIPKERFNQEAFYHPDAGRNGTSNVRGAHFLTQDLALFDAPFFNMTPAEAAALDPQQRLLLETCYEALENGGIPMSNVAGTDTSVFVGSFCRDWSDIMMRDPDSVPMYQATGGGQSLLSNRLSYFFNLRGPSISIDTACSASLVALHLACQSLKSGESKQAIVGGANVILSHELMISMSMMRFLSPDGRSYTYDSRANGYARGEGAACLVLKPLADALRDGDPVRAVIRNSGCNQDGKTLGITLPSSDAQAALIRNVYDAAGLDPLETTYVEAHGTGTPAGDPLEASALARCFSEGRSPEHPLSVGSVKTNIGHLEGASGLAGVIKTILMLENKLIPPNTNFEKPNPSIPLQEWKLSVPIETETWNATGIRRASINSFGYGGTNAHVIIDEAQAHLSQNDWIWQNGHGIHQRMATKIPQQVMNESNGHAHDDSDHWKLKHQPSSHQKERKASDLVNGDSNGIAYTNEAFGSEDLGSRIDCSSTRLFCISAFSEASAQQQAASLAEHLQATAPLHLENSNFLADLAYTLGLRRSVLPWKAAFIAPSISTLIDALRSSDGSFQQSNKAPTIAFIFTGQGAQWYGMGRELLGSYGVFSRSIRKSASFLKSLGAGWDLIDELLKDKGHTRVNSAELSQPMCTAIQVGLVDLLRSWNIVPSAVTGHSSGEIAAAYAAEALTQKETLAASYHRGMAVSSLESVGGNGAMLAVGLAEHEATQYLSALQHGKAVIACYNSPSSLTISGDESAIVELHETLKERNVFSRRLNVDRAYHSHHMEPVAKQYFDAIRHIDPKSTPAVEFYSSVTGNRLDCWKVGPQYWVDNMLNPVRFSDSVKNLCLGSGSNKKRRLRSPATAIDIMVEIGPHSALAGPVTQIVKADTKLSTSSIKYLSSLVRERNATEAMQTLAGQLFERGCSVSMSAVNRFDSNQRPTVLTNLPPYPWNHSTPYWAESQESKRYRQRANPRTDLLGVPVRQGNSIEPTWRHLIRTSELPWIRDHKVEGNIVYPAAGFITMAIEASAQIAASQGEDIVGFELREITIGTALIIPETVGESEVLFSLRPYNENSRSSSDLWSEFRVFSSSAEGNSVEHCRGLVSRRKAQKGSGTPHQSQPQLLARRRVAEARCSASIEVKDLYNGLKKIGLEYGPTFACVTEVRRGEAKAIATVRIPDTSAVMPSKFEYPYILHPATLDSCFHALFPAMGSLKEVLKQPSVPTFISSVFIDARLQNIAGKELKVCTENIGKSYRQTTSSILVFDSPSFEASPVINIEGFVTTSMSSTKDSEELRLKRRLCFHTHWDTDPSLLSAEQVIDLCTPSSPPKEESEHVKRLEEAAFYYVERALKQVTTNHLSKMPEHHQKLFSAITVFREAAYSGTLDYDTASWISADSIKQASVLEEVGSSGDEGGLLAQVGENLGRILRQEVEPLSVMMANDRLSKYYRHNARMARQYEQSACYINLLAHKNPHLRILELGAGTGGASFVILNALGGSEGNLPRFASYDYTDISTGFFEKAREQAAAWGDLVSFKKLDIENDPCAQGYEAGAYDVIIAANVLHATKLMERTMTNVRKLLKPGGSLVLTELTRKKGSMSVLFGILPGWWLGEEKSRQTSPLLTEEEWNEVLRRTGFSGVDVAIWDTPDEIAHHGSTIISRAVAQTNGVDTVDTTNVSVIYGGEKSSQLATHVVRELSGHARKVQKSKLTEFVSDTSIYIVLNELDQSLLRDPAPQTYDQLRKIITEADGVIWLTVGSLSGCQNPDGSLVTGLFRTVRAEIGGSVLATIDLDAERPLGEANVAKLISEVFVKHFPGEISASMEDVEYIERNGTLRIPRVIEDTEYSNFVESRTTSGVIEQQPFYQEDRPLRLEIGTPGLLDTLYYVDDLRLRLPLDPDHVQIEVKASGVNFRDVMMAMGQIGVQGLGGECCGIVSAIGDNVIKLKVGDRVVAFVDGSFANYARWPASGVEKIPDDMPFEVGATLPIIYCTAYHSIKVANLTAGETVLIHAASGGLGQALIMLCQNAGAEIFATVGTPEKREFLRSQYGIPDDHIMSSRDETFAAKLMQITNRQGVDVIFNSVTGDLLRRTFECIASFGRFIELGKKDFAVNSRLEMKSFARNVTFAAVDLVTLLAEKPLYGSKMWAEVMSLVREGIVRPPQPITVFSMGEIERALRTMQSGKHIGKLVVVPKGNEVVKVS